MVSLQETKRMAKRRAQASQEQAQRAGKDYQNAVESGFEAASRSFSEINSGFQTMATEMTDFSKKRFEDVLQSWDQLLRTRV
jgi:non-canonical (house-cleaning) NTP pyrophosphatase